MNANQIRALRSPLRSGNYFTVNRNAIRAIKDPLKVLVFSEVANSNASGFPFTRTSKELGVIYGKSERTIKSAITYLVEESIIRNSGTLKNPILTVVNKG